MNDRLNKQRREQRCSCGAALSHSYASILRDDFELLVRLFVQKRAQYMRDTAWLRPVGQRCSELLKGDLDLFHVVGGDQMISSLQVPFVHKKVVDQRTRIIVIGDLHGDYQALCAIIKELKEHDYLDRNDTLKPNILLVALGDYSNRGHESIPVIATLLHLYIHNPENVILLRGNHEFALSSQLFYRRALEKRTRGGAGVETIDRKEDVSLLEEMQERFGDYQFPDLLNWYDYLPLALYLGWSDAGHIKFIQLCHGGFEVGYNPHDLLSSTVDNQCEEIILLDRQKALKDIVSAKDSETLVDRMQAAFAYLEQSPSNGFEDVYKNPELIDFKQPQSLYKLRLGFIWNNFLSAANDAIDFAASMRRKNLIFGQRLTTYCMQQASSDKVKLQGIIRGHQHLNETIEVLGLRGTMLDDIRVGQGMVRQWNGQVYTLGAASDISGYQSFLVVSCAFGTVRHYFKRQEAAGFVFRMYHLLG